MKRFQCVQYTPDWWEIRAGIPTGSGFDRIITPAKAQKSAGQRGYMCELAADLAGYHLPNFFTNRDNRPKSHAMQVGTETEPEARRYYEMHRECEVQQVGFVTSDCNRFGCSPDGLIDDSKDGAGGLELKCPEAKTHLEWIIDGTLPAEYKPQVHGCLIVTGRPWWDFMSYVPHIRPFLIRVFPDEFTQKLRDVLAVFLDDYDMLVNALELNDAYKAAAAKRLEGGR